MRSIRGLDDPGLDFLRLASALAADPIPADLVVEVFTLTDGLEDAAAHDHAVTGMQEAYVASLAEMTDDGARQVHTLVSRTIRRLDSGPERTTKITQAATTALTRRLVDLQDGRVSADGTTLAHARALAGIPSDEHHAGLLQTVAAHDYLRGDYPSARHAQEQVLDLYRRVLGPEHSETLTSMNNLAVTLGRRVISWVHAPSKNKYWTFAGGFLGLSTPTQPRREAACTG